MGAGGLAGAVADAGPLIHLAEIGALPLLGVFGRLDVPGMVWSEAVERHGVPGPDLIALGIVRRRDVPADDLARFVRDSRLERLHAGEREALYLCRELGASLILTDDLAVRREATRLALTPVGSLGVVARAYRLGRTTLEGAERHIEALYRVSSLFVTSAIVDLAIEQLRREPG